LRLSSFNHLAACLQVAELTAVEKGEAPAPAAAAPAPAAAAAAKAKPVLPPTKPLEAPEEEQYTVHIPEGLTALDLDVIKMTAQFVARNGKSFLTGLASREHANPQFNFLKPTHSLFAFFTALCDAYSRVLMPPKDLRQRMEKDVADRCRLWRGGGAVGTVGWVGKGWEAGVAEWG
jgi:splicing factor 3A subunit 1